jgi:hypothetical protein
MNVGSTFATIRKASPRSRMTSNSGWIWSPWEGPKNSDASDRAPATQAMAAAATRGETANDLVDMVRAIIRDITVAA